MMNSVFITAAYGTIRYAIGSGLFDRTANLVRVLIHEQITGAEKRAHVVAFVKSETAELSGIAIDLVIAIVRARYEK
jgi:hypothetical protein